MLFRSSTPIDYARTAALQFVAEVVEEALPEGAPEDAVFRADDAGGLDAVGVSACGPSSAAVWPVRDDSAGGRGDCVAGVAVS